MKFTRRTLALVLAGVFTSATLAIHSRARAQPAPMEQYAPLTIDQLDQLVAPIALYPDAVLAQVLAASTYPQDVVQAAQWEDAGNNPAGIDGQNWDASVKGVARFPQILHYMASNGDWMNELGAAFLNQQADVSAAVQTMRAQAYSAGNLVSNADEQVIDDDGTIEVIPSNPDLIYIPVYDPAVIYLNRPHPVGDRWAPPISFGDGIRVGPWLDYDYDWHDHHVYVGDWGANRPWWHHDARDTHYFDNVRPGTFHSDDRGQRIQSGEWQRDARRPAPVFNERPTPRSADQRPGTGYPERGAGRPEAEPARAPAAPVERRGPVVTQQSQRGQESRARPVAPEARPVAAPRQDAPRAEARPQPAAAPRQDAPRAEARPQPAARAEPAARPAPARQAPRAAPPPAARPSAPVRGGATGGYQSGGDAARASSRGAASRGSSGGGRK